jgi:hypothetical protein
MAEKHLKTLGNLATNKGHAGLFACIQDLAMNGLRPERFDQSEQTIPNRQDVTQFLASWCLLAGLSQEECTAG